MSGSSGGGGHEVDLGRRKRSDTMQPEIKQTRKALDSLLNGMTHLKLSSWLASGCFLEITHLRKSSQTVRRTAAGHS